MAVLLTFAHVHVHFSRTVAVSYIYATALVPLVLWGLWQVVQTRQLCRYYRRVGIGFAGQSICGWLGLVCIGTTNYWGVVDRRS
jgi:hypothetical protein